MLDKKVRDCKAGGKLWQTDKNSFNYMKTLEPTFHISRKSESKWFKDCTQMDDWMLMGPAKRTVLPICNNKIVYYKLFIHPFS